MKKKRTVPFVLEVSLVANLIKLNTESLRSKMMQQDKNVMVVSSNNKPIWCAWQRGVKTKASSPFRTTEDIEKDVKRYPDISEERRLRLIAFPISESIIKKLLEGIEKGLKYETIFKQLEIKEAELLYYLQNMRLNQP